MKYEFLPSDEPYYKTDLSLVREKLKLLQLKDGEYLFDLGCGDARCLIEGRKMADILGIGYEMRTEAYAEAKENIQSAQLDRHIQLFQKNFFEADLSKANAVILYLTRFSLGRLSIKLEKELPDNARIITHEFDLPGWKAEKVLEVIQKRGNLIKLYFYRKLAN